LNYNPFYLIDNKFLFQLQIHLQLLCFNLLKITYFNITKNTCILEFIVRINRKLLGNTIYLKVTIKNGFFEVMGDMCKR